MKAVAFIGYSGVGKTTLIERLIPQLTALGLRVAVIKHAHHGFDLDRPGKDSWRARAAGAGQVLIAADQRWALLCETPAAPLPLVDLLERLEPCDLVLVEGFRRETGVPHIELRRTGLAAGPPAHADPRSVAVAADGLVTDPQLIAVAADGPVTTPLPLLDLNDAAKIAQFLLAHFGLEHAQR